MIKQNYKGFTLIELMITLAILSIIAAIAYPSYTGYTQTAKRTDAKVALMEAAQGLERCFTVNNAYNHADCTINATSEKAYYNITVARTASTFTLTATAAASQAGDSHCATFSITQTGAKTATNTDCW